MVDSEDLTVHEIYGRAWELGEIDPLGGAPTPLADFLRVAEGEDLRLSPEPGGEIESGPYRGGRVIAAEARDGRLYFMVPAAALPVLEPHFREAEARGIVHRRPIRTSRNRGEGGGRG